jgi:two-component system chemotaxis sensor kinase CheA
MSSNKDPYRYFRIEARELLDEMSGAVLGLDKDPAPAATVARLLRLAHTLKGAARVVKQTGIADHAHEIEDALTPWRSTTVALPGDALRPLLNRVDEMETMLGELAAPDDVGETSAAATQPVADMQSQAGQVGKVGHVSHNKATTGAPRPLEDAWKSLRADPEDLSALLGGITTSHMQIAAMKRHLAAAAHATELAELLLSQLSKRKHQRSGAEFAAAPEVAMVHDMAEELKARLTQLDTGLTRTTDQLDRELRQTRETAEQLKLVPARQLFTSLARTVRDVADAQGKQAVFHGEGGDVRLDAEVLAGLQPGLVQMVRNAVAHGVETPEQRQRVGKPVEGEVVLEVVRQGRHVCFVCRDDGAGVDVDAVVQSARRQGLLAMDAMVDDDALTRLLVQGGLSTAAVVSEVSGRGIGLNVVGDALQRLGGSLRMETRPGQGTTWYMTVPLVMASIAVLCLEAGGVPASVPLESVLHAMRVRSEDLSWNSEGQTLIHDGQAIPFAPLSQALKRDATLDTREVWSTLIVQAGDGMAAIGVDRLLGMAQIVMLPLPELMLTDELIAGATLDVEGKPQIVLDPLHLVRQVRSARQLPSKTSAPQAPLLVIDDSLTTRMLEQSILASAGYEVHVAISAEEGLDMVRRQSYALILVDVDMPGMDGFTFVQTIRQEEGLRHIPTILVTSRGAPEDRQRGVEVGANHYIVKGEFAQGAFLATVRRLIAETQKNKT